MLRMKRICILILFNIRAILARSTTASIVGLLLSAVKSVNSSLQGGREIKEAQKPDLIAQKQTGSICVDNVWIIN